MHIYWPQRKVLTLKNNLFQMVKRSYHRMGENNYQWEGMLLQDIINYSELNFPYIEIKKIPILFVSLK